MGSSKYTIRIILDWKLDAKHAIIWGAIEAGYFEDAPFTLELVEPPAKSANSLELVHSGKAELAINYPHNILLMREELPELVSVGALVRRNPEGLLTLRDSQIRNPADLRGKKIGIGPSPVSRGQFELFCKNQGISPADIEVVTVGFDGEDYLLSREIDALDAVQYAIPRTERKGHKVYFIPYTSFGVPDSPFLVFTGAKSWVDGVREDLPAFFQGLKKGLYLVKGWDLDAWKKYTDTIPGRNAEEEYEIWKATIPLMEESGQLFSHNIDECKKLQNILLSRDLLSTAYEMKTIFLNFFI